METFGPFRLLQQIEKDVLGDVFCAEWSDEAADASEELGGSQLLLRRFSRESLLSERFLERIEERRHLAGAELGEQLTTSRSLGVVEERAYDFFPYVSGTSLATQIEVAHRQRERFPLDVTLFIVGRLAIGLGVALRQEVEEGPLVHGFVVPQLVRVSEEGQVILGGLEVAAALQDLRGTAATFAQLFPYLAPERRSGQSLHPADDVYSLGALVYHMLTLRPLGSPSDLRAESRAIPSELRYFLARSVAERSRRIQSVVEWLRDLKALVVQEGWGATAQDLSTFLAEIDERVRPPKPDTTEITAEDRKKFARMIRQAQATEKDVAPEKRSSRSVDLDEARDSYDTNVLTGEDLRPLFDEEGLLRSAEIRRPSETYWMT